MLLFELQRVPVYKYVHILAQRYALYKYVYIFVHVHQSVPSKVRGNTVFVVFGATSTRDALLA